MKNNNSKIITLIALLSTFGFAISSPADVVVQNKQTIAFMGDSITWAGADTPVGYVRLTVSGLAANGIEVTPFPAGVPGETSRNMLERLDREILSKKPDWMTLSCGVNDVWHKERGVALDKYKENITAIIDRAQAAGVKVVLLTSTMIFEKQDDPLNQTLIAYNDFLRQIAQQKGCRIADLNTMMQEQVKTNIQATGGKAPGNFLTVDGVHMNPLGNEMMAIGVLRAFGLDDAQLDKAKKSWLEIPRSSAVDSRDMMTLKQFKLLNQIALKRNISVQDLCNELFTHAVDKAVKNQRLSQP